MIGGLIGRPLLCSTGPGRPTPIASRSPGRGRAARAARARRWITQLSTASGPSATRMRSLLSAWMRPVRSLTAMRTWEAPTSTPSTTSPARRRSRTATTGGRRSRRASPTGPTRPSLHERVDAQARRSSGRGRSSPTSSVRVRGRPSRRIWNRSLATDDPRAVTCPSCPLATYVGHGSILPQSPIKVSRARSQGCPPFGCHDSSAARMPAARSSLGLQHAPWTEDRGHRVDHPQEVRRVDPAPLHHLVGRRARGRPAAPRTRRGTPRSRRCRRGRPRDSGTPAARAGARRLDAELVPQPPADRRLDVLARRRVPAAGVRPDARARSASPSERRVRSIRPSRSKP